MKDRGVSLDEPVLLMPPPPIDCGLQDSPYDPGPVDALVLHPPDEGVAPGKRTVPFPDSMQRVDGRWTSNVWPVVVSAYRQGEPVDAIPRDQVMLRQNETRFPLWIPAGMEHEKDRPEEAGQHLAGYAHRVAMSNGRLVKIAGGLVRVCRAELCFVFRAGRLVAGEMWESWQPA